MRRLFQVKQYPPRGGSPMPAVSPRRGSGLFLRAAKALWCFPCSQMAAGKPRGIYNPVHGIANRFLIWNLQSCSGHCWSWIMICSRFLVRGFGITAGSASPEWRLLPLQISSINSAVFPSDDRVLCHMRGSWWKRENSQELRIWASCRVCGTEKSQVYFSVSICKYGSSSFFLSHYFFYLFLKFLFFFSFLKGEAYTWCIWDTPLVLCASLSLRSQLSIKALWWGENHQSFMHSLSWLRYKTWKNNFWFDRIHKKSSKNKAK